MPHPAPHRPRLRLAAILPVLVVAVVLGCASHVLLTASVSTLDRFIDVFMHVTTALGRGPLDPFQPTGQRR
jgi:hypothetical protein